MQKRSLTASWESQLRSYESELSPDRPRSPKHAHLPQSSSPSFLEAYAKYVEQQRESDLSRDSSGSSQRQSQGIRAFSGSQTARSDDKASPPDARRDTSDSGYSSWPGALFAIPSPALPCGCNLSLEAKMLSASKERCCKALKQCDVVVLRHSETLLSSCSISQHRQPREAGPPGQASQAICRVAPFAFQLLAQQVSAINRCAAR